MSMQLGVCDHNQHHLVNAYEVEAGMFAGKTVWSMHERLEVLRLGAL